MKKSESANDIRIHSVWDLKTYEITIPPYNEAKSISEIALSKVNAFKEKLQQSIQPIVHFPKIPPRIKKRRAREYSRKLTSSFSKQKNRQECGVNRHFAELENHFLSVSNGKVSLNSIVSEKKIVEKTEEITTHTFDLDNRFSEDFRTKLNELKTKEQKMRLIIRKKYEARIVSKAKYNNC